MMLAQVILFDEIEEFCLDRETPGLGMESRMLTTSMLTKINDLRRGRKSIFFVATNRLRAFDSAVTRPGRFDLQVGVGETRGGDGDKSGDSGDGDDDKSGDSGDGNNDDDNAALAFREEEGREGVWKRISQS